MDAAYWEELCPGGLRFLYGNGQFPPGLDSFVLSSMPRLKPGLRVCDLGCGTGFLSILLLQRQRQDRCLADIRAMSQKAAAMVKRAIFSYVNRDAQAARQLDLAPNGSALLANDQQTWLYIPK